jgi:hypothetical protein
MRIFTPILAAVAFLAFPAQAQMGKVESSSQCLLPELTQLWSRGAQSTAAHLQRGAEALALQTSRTWSSQLPVCDGKRCESGQFSGWFAVDIPKAGRYRIAVNHRALWIDVFVKDQKAEGLMCESGGCDPIRKILQYELPAGVIWLQLTGKADPQAQFLVDPVAEGDKVGPPVKANMKGKS